MVRYQTLYTLLIRVQDDYTMLVLDIGLFKASKRADHAVRMVSCQCEPRDEPLPVSH